MLRLEQCTNIPSEASFENITKALMLCYKCHVNN